MADEHTTGSPRTLKTVSRAFDVVRALEELDGARVTELANHLDLSKSVVYNYLSTLRAEKFVVKEEDTYRLSLQFLLVGEYVRYQNILYRIGKPEIEELAEKTGEYAHLATEQHGLGVNLYKVSGEKAVGSDYQVNKLQRADYLHFSATGKAILAHLPKERVEWIVDQYGLPRKTEATITTREELFEELETIRDRGYSLNDEEEIKGLQAIGAPVTNRHGRVLGSISVSGPVRRMKQPEYHERLIESVVNTANVIEVNVNMEESDDDFPTFS
ncbi:MULTISPECIES: IclR family transcriptional regulator [Haloferax]|uniref:Pectin degradation repressor protein KdgR n=1 Tax=Haloferax massiliensis TaxID=1476858 RepID=A0A0D6JVP3_9EURY|nr:MULTISPECIES: IclR family transcriptional regulator [Haloferax]MDS0242242.1 IclR family transcriptional regulator [Haloferax sp. S2CR25]MDS0445363.1 IclR family transcriptional regulator [Haloferax sp. S2CR25-2]CQR53032.1 Pectin degradation repressor protein KdgR [Haloferax massiliensis]